MKFIKPEIEFIKYESNDIIATSMTIFDNIINLTGENVFLEGEVLLKLEKQYSGGTTKNAAFIDVNNYTTSMSINTGYFYQVNCVEDIGTIPNGFNGSKTWPAFRITLNDLKGNESAKGKVFEDDSGAADFTNWLMNYMQ